MEKKIEHLVLDQVDQWIGKRRRLMVACSGGLDSVVLGHVLANAGRLAGLLHMNFQLRGSESDADEAFVLALGAQWDVAVEIERRATLEVAWAEESIQMTARRLRYDWFNSWLSAHPSGIIALAHHGDDQIETVLMQMMRGSGPAGMAGMPERRGRLLRPMIGVSREEILAYGHQFGLAWREDSSNADAKYLRNRVRHELLPLLRELKPGFDRVMQRQTKVWREVEAWTRQSAKAWLHRNLEREGSAEWLPTKLLSGHPYRRSILHYWLGDSEWGEALLDEVDRAMDRPEAQRWTQHDRVLALDRKEIRLFDPTVPVQGAQHILEDLKCQGEWIFEQVRLEQPLGKIDGNYVDWDRLTFPLLLRPWRSSDYLYPMGLYKAGGQPARKKVKDVIQAAKVPQSQRKGVQVLLSGEYVVAVMGIRVDERFRLGPRSERALHMYSK